MHASADGGPLPGVGKGIAELVQRGVGGTRLLDRSWWGSAFLAATLLGAVWLGATGLGAIGLGGCAAPYTDGAGPVSDESLPAAGYGLMFEAGDGALRLASPWSAEAETIAAGCAPGGATWSPDGRYVYYLTEPAVSGEASALVRIDLESGERVQMAEFPAGHGVPTGAGPMEPQLAVSSPEIPRLARSPDGAYLAIRGATEVFLRVGYQPIALFDLLVLSVAADRARVVETLEAYGAYAWGPDGRLAYGRVEPVELELPVGNGESSSLYVWDPATGEPERIIAGSDVFLCWPVEWPDPGRLYYHVVGVKGESPTLWGAAPVAVGVIDPDQPAAGGRSVDEPSLWQEPSRVVPLLPERLRDQFRGVQDLAPDGSAVALLTGSGEASGPESVLTIQVFDPVTGRLWPISEGRSARWSPVPLEDPGDQGGGP